jgi:hypothetical protein
MGQSNIRARLLDYAAVSVAINGAGAGETVVLFSEDYVSTPDILVVQNEADEAAGAVYRVKSGTDTKDGFTLEVTGSSRISRTISVKYVAHEKD